MSDLINIHNDGSKLLVSSREVAKNFEKDHKHVIEKIENLMVENSAVRNMFIESEYMSDRGRKYKEYLMTRDGFSLLVMGFTGTKALTWKLKYIEAFNLMEDRIKQDAIPKTYAQALLEAGRLALENEKLTEDNIKKGKIIKLITDDNITFEEFDKRIRTLICLIARDKKLAHGVVWNTIYSYVNTKIKINLKLRKSNKIKRVQEERIADGKKPYADSTLDQKFSTLSMVREEEYDKILKIVLCYCNEQEINIIDYDKLVIDENIDDIF